MSPDPFAQFYSPYVSMANNPILYIDPNGGWAGPGWLKKLWNWVQGKGWTDHHTGHIPGKTNNPEFDGGAGEKLGEESGYSDCGCGGEGGGSGDLSVFSSPESGPRSNSSNSKFGSGGGSGSFGGSYQSLDRRTDMDMLKAYQSKVAYEKLVADTWKNPPPPGEKRGGFANSTQTPQNPLTEEDHLKQLYTVKFKEDFDFLNDLYWDVTSNGGEQWNFIFDDVIDYWSAKGPVRLYDEKNKKERCARIYYIDMSGVNNSPIKPNRMTTNIFREILPGKSSNPLRLFKLDFQKIDLEHDSQIKYQLFMEELPIEKCLYM
jgi:hypothetical protein